MEEKQREVYILIVGILGMLTTINFVWLSWIFGILAVIFGYRDRKNTFAKTGFILGILTLAILIFIKIIFPLITGVATPLMISRSCSMYHEERGFTDIFENSEVYSENSISIPDAQSWAFQNGLNKGDLVFVSSPKNIRVGDIIIFRAGKGFIPHRVISVSPLMTKGDNNYAQLPFEKSIEESQVIGKVSLRIPFIGWSRIIFTDYQNPPNEKGFCY